MSEPGMIATSPATMLCMAIARVRCAIRTASATGCGLSASKMTSAASDDAAMCTANNYMVEAGSIG